MFNQLEPLDRIKHAKLKVKPLDGFHFASKITHSFLGGSEVAEASKYFPIVFPEKTEGGQTFLPIALFSLSKDENYFVSGDGKWKAEYIPNHLRRYPFIFAVVPEKKNQFAIMLDTACPQLNENEGTPFFNEKGEPEEIINRVKTFLSHFQMDIEKTQGLMSLLEEKDILVSKQFTITKGDKKNFVQGFRVIDVTKLEKLDDLTLSKWVRNGLMGIIYAHFNSLSNLKKVAAAQGAAENAS